MTIQRYANASFVNVLLEKSFYTRLERMAKKLRTTPDINHQQRTTPHTEEAGRKNEGGI